MKCCEWINLWIVGFVWIDVEEEDDYVFCIYVCNGMLEC